MSRSAQRLSRSGARKAKGAERIDRPTAFGLRQARVKLKDLLTVTETTLTYRLALPSDRWALAWIEAHSFGWGRLLGGQWPALDGRRTCGWLACDPAGRARGYALVEPRDGRRYVPGIGVLPDWRRRGIGEQLMRLVLGAHRDVWLHARESNAAARRLYDRLGLRETGRVPHFYSDGEAAMVIEAT